MVLINLFIVFFKIGLFAIGGAYSFLPLLEREIVEKNQWLAKSEFLDILGLIKTLPGAISIHYASYTGYKVAGIPGAIAANLGNLLPPATLIIFVSFFYFKYRDLSIVKSAFNMIALVVFAMIIAVAFKLIDIKQLLPFKNLLIVLVSFVLFMFIKIHPAFIIIGAGILGAVLRF